MQDRAKALIRFYYEIGIAMVRNRGNMDGLGNDMRGL